MVAVREYREADLESVVQLYHGAFRTTFGDEFSYILNENAFRRRASSNTIVVAESNRTIVGFGEYSRCAAEDEFFEDISQKVAFAGQLAPLAEMGLPCNELIEISEGVSFEVYANQLTLSQPTVAHTDAYFTALAVHPEHQRKGIGRVLTEYRIHTAREWGAQRAFVGCVEDGHSQALYESLDFEPLIFLKPVYSGGLGCLYMGKQISAD